MESRRIKGIIIILITLLAVIIFALISSLNVHASDISDKDIERLNALELRLKDYEHTIENIRESINILFENDNYQYEQRLEIQHQLDVMIVGVNEILNLYIDEQEKNALRDERLEQYENNVTAILGNMIILLENNKTEMTKINDSLIIMESSLEQIIDINETGNHLIETMTENLGNEIKESTEKTLNELNETLTITNTFLSYAFLIMLGLFVVALIRVAVRWFKDTLLNHIY